MRAPTAGLLVAAVAMLAACSPRAVAESLLLGDGFTLTPDVAYAAGPRQRLDVYRPREGPHAAPVVVFLYGGRWQSGSKAQYHLLGDALTRQGIVAVIPDYRLYPAVRFPGWVEDAAAAVRWTREHIATYGGDPDRITIVGHSAGGHTAALLALDPHYLRAAGVPPRAIRGYVILAGPVATAWTDADVRALMGPERGWAATYPMRLANGQAPPLLLLQGGRDRVVAPANADRLAARVRSVGGCARAKAYRGLDHVGIVVAFAVPRLNLAPVFDDVLRFIAAPSVGC